ncbi:MAG: glycosyltransferase [Elusimicrobiales bacterium]|nr:glycosyltransferase [Elusimicrobiales bacterium]
MVKISVVVPAFNEEKLLGVCLESVRTAFASFPGTELELIVCDNNSTDGTARAAAAAGALVVFEPLNMISLARNSGAGAASGEWLLFIDADSVLSAATLGAALGLMRGGGCVGGGALIAFERPAPPAWGRALTGLWNLISRVFRLAAGSFLFCRRDAFVWVGGFSPLLYAAEELALSRALRRRGLAKGLAFEIITSAPHVSSGRKFRLYKVADLFWDAFKLLLRPFSSVKDPSRLRVFYEGRR